MTQKQEKLLIFTGAGFSNALSSRFLTTREMYKKIKEAQGQSDGIINLDYFESCFDEPNKSEINIESLAKKISTNRQLIKQLHPNPNESINLSGDHQPVTGTSQQIQDNWQASLDYINQNVLNELFSVRLLLSSKSYFKKFIKEIQKYFVEFNIVTTNYDRAIRQLQDNPHYYLRDDCEVNIEAILQQNADGYCYIPLKGMLDWRWTDNAAGFRRDDSPLRGILGARWARRRKIIEQGFKIFGNTIEESVVMTLENESGNLQSPHKQLYDKFEQELQTSNRLLFIGFSFNDELVNEVIRTLTSKKIKRIVIVTQDATKDAQEFEARVRAQVIPTQYQDKQKQKDKVSFISSGFKLRDTQNIFDELLS